MMDNLKGKIQTEGEEGEVATNKLIDQLKIHSIYLNPDATLVDENIHRHQLT